MGETPSDELGSADAGCGQDGSVAADPLPAINGHAIPPPSDDQLSLFFQRFPCGVGAQARLVACAATVARQVLGGFRPDVLGQPDYSSQLLSFIDEIQSSGGPHQGSQDSEGKNASSAELLEAFTKKYYISEASLEMLSTLPEDVVQDLLEHFNPFLPNADHTRLVIAYVNKLLRRRGLEQLPDLIIPKVDSCRSEVQEWRIAVPVGVALTEPECRDALLQCRVVGRWEQALDLLWHLHRTDSLSNVDTVNLVLGACRRGCQWEHALLLVQQMPDMHLAPDASSFRHVVGACSDANCWDKVAYLSEEMRQSGVPLSSCSMAVNETFRAYEKSMQWNNALALLGELRATGAEATAANLRSAMRACETKGRWEHCIELLSELRSADTVQDLEHCRSALFACVKEKQWQAALSMLMLTIEEMEDDAPPFWFEGVISCCKENQRWDIALGLLHRMLTLGPTPDCCCYNAVITACAKGRSDTTQWEWALHLLENMSQPEVGATARVGVLPSAGTFGEVMAACQKARKSQFSLDLFVRMQEKGLTPTYTCKHGAMRACESLGNWEEALSVYEQHIQHLSVRSEPERLDLGVESLMCCSLISALKKAGQLHRLYDGVLTRLRNLGELVMDASLKDWLDVNQRRPIMGRLRGRSKDSNLTEIGYSHMALTKLCGLDALPGRSLQRWKRAVQRTVEADLRDLHPLVCRWCTLPHPRVKQERIRSMNDLDRMFTGDILLRMGMQCLRFPEGSPLNVVMHRSIWWDIDRLPPDPEGWYVEALIRYSVRLGEGLPQLRSPGKMARYSNRDFCRSALTPVRMMQDRMEHRGWHAERTALLGLSLRILLRYHKLSDNEGWPKGHVHLHVNHTPCLSCMAVITQFRGRFPDLSFSVTFDVWWDLRAPQQDIWHTCWPRWLPLAVKPQEGVDEWCRPRHGQSAEVVEVEAEEGGGGRRLEEPDKWGLRGCQEEAEVAEAEAAVEGGGEVRSLEERLLDFRACFPMSERVFAVLSSSPRKVQEMVMDAVREDSSADLEDFSKLVMQSVVQLRRQWSAAAEQQRVEEAAA